MNHEKWLERAKRTSARFDVAPMPTPAFIGVEWPPKSNMPPPPPETAFKALQDAIRGMGKTLSTSFNPDDMVFDSYADMSKKLFVMPRRCGKTSMVAAHKTSMAREKLATASRNMERMLFGNEPTLPDFPLKTIKFDPEHLKQLKEEQEKRLAMEEELARPAREAIGYGEW